jgi:ribosomal 50S subunit-recycling heat shock protein
MRLDKFLKVSRIIKRRTVAQGFAEHGRVTVNGRVAKPATAVKVGDRIRIVSGGQETEYEVLDIQPNVRAELAHTMYRLV